MCIAVVDNMGMYVEFIYDQLVRTTLLPCAFELPIYVHANVLLVCVCVCLCYVACQPINAFIYHVVMKTR